MNIIKFKIAVNTASAIIVLAIISDTFRFTVLIDLRKSINESTHINANAAPITWLRNVITVESISIL